MKSWDSYFQSVLILQSWKTYLNQQYFWLVVWWLRTYNAIGLGRRTRVRFVSAIFRRGFRNKGSSRFLGVRLSPPSDYLHIPSINLCNFHQVNIYNKTNIENMPSSLTRSTSFFVWLLFLFCFRCKSQSFFKGRSPRIFCY